MSNLLGSDKIMRFKAEYLGGHIGFPDKCGTKITLTQSGLYIEKFDLSIAYGSITSIENKTLEYQGKFSHPMYKHKMLMTVLRYADKYATVHTMNFKAEGDMKKAQVLIYQKAMEAREQTDHEEREEEASIPTKQSPINRVKPLSPIDTSKRTRADELKRKAAEEFRGGNLSAAVQLYNEVLAIYPNDSVI